MPRPLPEHPRVWVTGAGGLIGHHLVAAAPGCVPGWDVRGLTRPQLDLTEPAAVSAHFRETRPDLVIHAAALSKTVACEQDPALARVLNVEVTRRLADLAAGIPFIFFSTDLVFDGARGNYDESAPPRPLNVYGRTKADAESQVLANPGHTVIRTSLNAGISPTGDRAFNEELAARWRQGVPMTCFVDEYRCPIPAVVTARAVWELAAGGATGLFHLAGAERLSRHAIAGLLAERQPGPRPEVAAGTLRDYRGPARAADTSLDCSRVQARLGFPLPRFSDWVRHRENRV